MSIEGLIDVVTFVLKTYLFFIGAVNIGSFIWNNYPTVTSAHKKLLYGSLVIMVNLMLIKFTWSEVLLHISNGGRNKIQVDDVEKSLKTEINS